MEDRPTGTVTFLFTDIEGSTGRWQADRSAMEVALAAHDEVLRTCVEGHEGQVVKHTGDGIMAVFTSVGDAVAAATGAQARLELPVRMGIHTGEAQLRDGDYFGPTLNRAARIMGAGHGHQILVSSSTAPLLAASKGSSSSTSARTGSRTSSASNRSGRSARPRIRRCGCSTPRRGTSRPNHPSCSAGRRPSPMLPGS